MSFYRSRPMQAAQLQDNSQITLAKREHSSLPCISATLIKTERFYRQILGRSDRGSSSPILALYALILTFAARANP